MTKGVAERLLSRGRGLQDRAPLLARGYFERLEYKDGKLLLSGWMLLREKPLDSFALYINQHKVMEVKTASRPDVAQVFAWIPHARNTGFTFSVHYPHQAMNELLDICVVGTAKGKERAKMETWYRMDVYSGLPTPAPHLISRVAAHESPHFYLVTGWQNYQEYWTTVCRHADPRSIKSMLDWGCGCGRILSYFSKFSGIPRICGCDIDAEAIAWCQKNLSLVEASEIPPYPPTNYADNAFDLVVSYSVLTHLSKEVQFAWLEEIRRILKPGGLLIASVHGEFAASYRFQGTKIPSLRDSGIHEDVDHRLDGIAPDGYYRGTYQSKDYTLREWSRYFEILEYREAAAGNFQDLVVMKKRDPDVAGYESP